jgi:hypothetical protein
VGIENVPTTDATMAAKPALRQFSTGANRDTDQGKYDYDGFLSPLAIEAFGAYMHFNRHLPDGSLRDADNWQLGIPLEVYRKSLWRHHYEAWRGLRGWKIKENVLWALCGVLFNAMGLIHELMKGDPKLLDRSISEMERARTLQWKGARRAKR